VLELFFIAVIARHDTSMLKSGFKTGARTLACFIIEFLFWVWL